LRTYRSYADDHDLYLWRVFFEPGFEPGVGDLQKLPMHKREQLAKLVIEARTRSIRLVLVDKRSRLHRVPVVLAVLCRYFKSLGIRIIETSTEMELTSDDTVLRALRLTNPTRVRRAKRLVRGFLALVASRPGRKPFGSHNDEEQETLARMKALYRVLPKDQRRCYRDVMQQRRSFHEIARILNDEGRSTRTGKSWSASTVRRILMRQEGRNV
jgi:hypothetical protein